jgi:hypothetical protein
MGTENNLQQSAVVRDDLHGGTAVPPCRYRYFLVCVLGMVLHLAAFGVCGGLWDGMAASGVLCGEKFTAVYF